MKTSQKTSHSRSGPEPPKCLGSGGEDIPFFKPCTSKISGQKCVQNRNQHVSKINQGVNFLSLPPQALYLQNIQTEMHPKSKSTCLKNQSRGHFLEPHVASYCFYSLRSSLSPSKISRKVFATSSSITITIHPQTYQNPPHNKS